MKKLILLFVLSVSCISFNSNAQDALTSSQLTFRSSVYNFLKEEGFSPYIDNSDNSVMFKTEGKVYWIIVSDDSPFFVTFRRSGFNFNKDKIGYVYIAANTVNKEKKAVKLYLSDTNVIIGIESYTRSVEDFKYVFYKSLRTIDDAKESFMEKYKALLNDDNSPIAEIKEIKMEHNVYKDGEKGAYIYVSFEVENLKNKQAKCNVYFYNNDGTCLKDLNYKYNTVNGCVATWDSFTPSYDNSTYTKFKIFMPYSELHLSNGNYDLKASSGIYYNGERIDKGDDKYVYFTYSK